MADSSCESCGTPIANEALVCIQCGYDRRLGSRRGMKRDTRPQHKKDIVEVDMGSVRDLFTPILAVMKPVARIVWLWVVLAAAIIPLALFPLAYMVVFTVFGILSVGSLGWIVFVAFEEDWLCAVLVLFVPFYVVYYVITRWENQDENAMPFHFFLIAGAGDLYLTVVYAVHLLLSQAGAIG